MRTAPATKAAARAAGSNSNVPRLFRVEIAILAIDTQAAANEGVFLCPVDDEFGFDFVVGHCVFPDRCESAIL